VGNVAAGFTPVLTMKWYVVKVDEATPKRAWDTATPSRGGILAQPVTDSASVSDCSISLKRVCSTFHAPRQSCISVVVIVVAAHSSPLLSVVVELEKISQRIWIVP